MDGGQRRTETGCRVEPAAVRHAGGERSAQHRFPRGAAGIDKGSAAASLVPFTAEEINETPQRLVNGTIPPKPYANPIAGWRVPLIRPTGSVRFCRPDKAQPPSGNGAAALSKRNAIQVYAGIGVIKTIPDIRPAEALIIIAEGGVEVQLIKAHRFCLLHNMPL